MKAQLHIYLHMANELLLLSLGIAMVVISALAFENLNFDASIQNQIVSDWVKHPFVDL
jgi:hypothetical protein